MEAISFFAGAGGLDLGIRRAGFNIRLALELEQVYCDTLINNGHHNVRQGNVMNYTAERIRDESNLNNNQEIDLIFGGSPCQSFSTAGNRQAFSDPRGQAMLKFAELVNDLQPKFFLLENVRGLLSAALRHRPINQRGENFPPLDVDEMPGSALQHLLNIFGNYNVTVQLVNAADYGVPQKRERVFIIGTRNDLSITYNFPQPTHNEEGADGLPRWRTFRDIYENLDIEEHHYANYSAERLFYMRMIPQGGGNWRDLPEECIQEAMGGAFTSGGGKVGFYRRIKLDKPSPTLLTSPIQKSTNIGHPLEDRPLSIEEYLAIQEFPKGYQVYGSISQKYTQIGNAVPVRLAEIIGLSIAHSINLLHVNR
ncbi:DNA cytosine methyltransferase [Bacillus safensis]|uniref:DNA cytosine methyltransferase n=1 Tax=Bacillus safensis TaxID=561879 RepID=UPI00227F5BF3|nr:DNA cytosine methyltransferase [Bacillus safensis]MCY7708062.1 DNA cytosine methyltransferase [Bacillus safensis]MCY7727424.1 DNA cytosine methyltransferase [Bacillus safensis]MED0882285.1 DNA cytosine methyltransferase [Bacillus safensis]MED0917571.1 DNA cytosine methyltransferase [Bacillus safensis]